MFFGSVANTSMFRMCLMHTSFLRLSMTAPLVCLFITQAQTYAHETADVAVAKTANESQLAKGIVFLDRSGDGVRDADEPGLAGVRVSNGRDVVLTDDQGRYELMVDDDTIVFVIKPRGFATEIDENQLPRFFYIHKPNGSPKDFRFAGVAPTGDLPESIDFPLRPNAEPDKFKALLFGDPQPRNLREVEYIAHDVIEQIVMEESHDASFGVTLGDIVFDDLSVMKPLSQAIALIGIPWYNVIGNHDINTDAPNDQLSDETFERHYGPSYYSFDHGPAHFLVLDDVEWHGPKDGERGHYHGGLGEKQIEFIRNDLALIPEDQLVVLMMHIPLGSVKDRQDLYRLIENRPATVSISAHTHYMEHRYIGKEDGWMGPEPHHHIVNVTVGGSWWRGQKDERGIPHATMSDGGPNGYSIMEFDGNDYTLAFRGAGKPAHYQMSINCAEEISQEESAKTQVTVNVFNGSEKTVVRMRVGSDGAWSALERFTGVDENFSGAKAREKEISDRNWTELPGPHRTPHLWKANLAAELPVGTHLIEVEAVTGGKRVTGNRIVRVLP